MIGFYYKHYIRLDSSGRVVYGFSTAFEEPQNGDILLTDKGGYQFRLAPGGEENPCLATMDGIPLYRWDGTQAIHRTAEEIEADRRARPAPPPTEQELMKSDILELQNALCEQDMLNEQKFNEIDMALCDLDTTGGV